MASGTSDFACAAGPGAPCEPVSPSEMNRSAQGPSSDVSASQRKKLYETPQCCDTRLPIFRLSFQSTGRAINVTAETTRLKSKTKPPIATIKSSSPKVIAAAAAKVVVVILKLIREYGTATGGAFYQGAFGCGIEAGIKLIFPS